MPKTDNTTKDKEQAVAVFDKADVIANAGAFKTTPEIMAGALSTIKKNKITRQEASDAVKAFLKRPVRKG